MGFFLRKQREEEVKMAGRLPPGQALTQKFPVLHYGAVPTYNNLNNWNFRVFGLVEEERLWNWEQFNQLPRTSATLDIHCVTGWSKFDCPWEGVSVKSLIDAGLIKIKPEAKYVIQHCEFG